MGNREKDEGLTVWLQAGIIPVRFRAVLGRDWGLGIQVVGPPNNAFWARGSLVQRRKAVRSLSWSPRECAVVVAVLLSGALGVSFGAPRPMSAEEMAAVRGGGTCCTGLAATKFPGTCSDSTECTGYYDPAYYCFHSFRREALKQRMCKDCAPPYADCEGRTQYHEVCSRNVFYKGYDCSGGQCVQNIYSVWSCIEGTPDP